jgi:hypothetical protein
MKKKKDTDARDTAEKSFNRPCSSTADDASSAD